jgi:serine phosphatase RsbU (regulator of sigma subunit)/anti-sigma regulatory factor (Ser/Thr protein kinase)
MPSPMRAENVFPADARSVSRARRLTRERLLEWGAGELVDSASLIVSELVTNAVVHAGTTARLVLRLQGQELRLEVEDQHPARTIPVVPGLDPLHADHGRGLLITRSLSSAWGVEYTATTKRVWARCELTGDGAARRWRPSTPLAAGQAVRVAVVEAAGGVVTRWNDDASALFGWAAQEVVGRFLADLLDLTDHARADRGGAGTSAPWQGTSAVACRDGSTATVFASHVCGEDGAGTVLLLVPEAHRALLEHPRRAPAVVQDPAPPFGLPDDSLLRLGGEEYLSLAVERARDPVSADATYLLLAHDVDDELEVVAVSGLPEAVRGTRVAPGSPGGPDQIRPQTPVMVPDLSELSVPVLDGAGLRSLLVVPLVVEGRTIGALAAASARVDGFTPDQAQLLQRIAGSVALAADRARLKASERERRGWLGFIADAGDLLAGSLDQQMTMAITGQIIVPRIATWCAIYTSDQRGRPALQQVWHEDERQVDTLRAALETTPPDQPVDIEDRTPGYGVTNIPLVARGRQIGLMVIGRPNGQPLRGEFFLVAESIARRAALAIDNARAHGNLQAVGRALQESLLPPSVPTAPGLDIGVVYEPAGIDAVVGGDFYDLFPVGHETWCFVVGDVCGTGAEAAAVTGLARHTLRALVCAGFPVPAALERLNTAILDEGARGRFLTLTCGVLQLRRGEVHLSLVNAGHPPPFLVKGSGDVRELGRPQALLGAIDTVAYAAEDHVLSRGDLIVALTDGVLERRDGDHMLGEGVLAEELPLMAQLPAQAVVDRIRRLVLEFSATPQQDDMAIMAIRVQMGATTPLHDGDGGSTGSVVRTGRAHAGPGDVVGS